MENDEKKGKNRREMITLGSAFGLLGLVAAGTGGALFKYMFPVVSYGTPKKFLVPVDDLPEVGDELIFEDQKVILRRQSATEVAAISLVCTHLGCTVNRVETGFLCPCHGSQYDSDGRHRKRCRGWRSSVFRATRSKLIQALHCRKALSSPSCSRLRSTKGN